MKYPRVYPPSGGEITPFETPTRSVPEFGALPNRIKVRTIALGTALDMKEINLGGSMLWCVDAFSLTTNIQIRFQNQEQDPITFRKGMMIRGIDFNQLFVSCTAQAGASITLMAVVEDDKNINIENPAIDFTVTNPTRPDHIHSAANLTIVAAAAAVAIFPADATRYDAVIQASPPNTQNLRIGDSAVTGTEGHVLQPGETLILHTTGVIYCFTAAGADQVVHLLETHIT